MCCRPSGALFHHTRHHSCGWNCRPRGVPPSCSIGCTQGCSNPGFSAAYKRADPPFFPNSRQSFQLALVCGQVPKQATHTPTPYRNLDTPDPTKVKICQTQIRSRLLIIWIENWTTHWDSVGQVGCVDLAVCGLGYMVDADLPPSRVCVLCKSLTHAMSSSYSTCSM